LRKEGEADLANPNISEEEKRLIRRCLGLDDPGKAAESNRYDRVLLDATIFAVRVATLFANDMEPPMIASLEAGFLCLSLGKCRIRASGTRRSLTD
jgi:hypothetical protein